MSEVSLVLRRDVTRAGAAGAVRAALREIDDELGATFRSVGEQDQPSGAHEMIWQDTNLGLGTISLVDDPVVPTLYVNIDASDRARRDLVTAMQRHVPWVPVGELQSEAERGDPTRTAALIRLGMGEHRLYDERTCQLLVTGLESPDPEVRRAAMTGIFLLKWSAFAPSLKKALARETDHGLREQLDLTLQLTQGAILV